MTTDPASYARNTSLAITGGRRDAVVSDEDDVSTLAATSQTFDRLAAPTRWHVPSVRHAWAHPVDDLTAVDQWLLRVLAAAAAGAVQRIDGVEHIGRDRDPFILALNHTCRREALLIPALLVLLRGGRRIHMLADWNFKLVPGIATLYDRSGVIVVDQKPARPRWLGVLRPWLVGPEPAHDRARAALVAGRSIGVFPEGTVNSDQRRLLRGRTGAARLAVDTGARLVPAGIRRSMDGRLSLHIGAPLTPSPGDVRATHATLMQSIAALSGKSWSPRS